MKLLAGLFAALLAFGGLVFLVAAGQANFVPRLIIGLVLLGSAAVIVALQRMRPVERVRRQEVHLTGDVSLEHLRCRDCGATLDRGSASIQAGAAFASCGHCGGSYQLEEAPKW